MELILMQISATAALLLGYLSAVVRDRHFPRPHKSTAALPTEWFPEHLECQG
jgi:hypothetical protein